MASIIPRVASLAVQLFSSLEPAPCPAKLRVGVAEPSPPEEDIAGQGVAGQDVAGQGVSGQAVGGQEVLT